METAACPGFILGKGGGAKKKFMGTELMTKIFSAPPPLKRFCPPGQNRQERRGAKRGRII